jgi:hypothetical protein
MTLQCLHTTPGGQIWVYNGTTEPVAVNASPTQFIKHYITQPKPTTYRLIGSPINAELILALHKQAQVVEVCSPLIGGTYKERQNTQQLLYHTYMCNLPPQLGGPHSLTEFESHTYELADCMYINNNHYPEHPLWSQLNWIRGLNKQATHKLLGIITDPRWYVDLNNPNRLSKLYAYLKLDPESMRTILNNKYGNLGVYTRGKAVLDCWYSESLAATVLRNYTQFGSIINQDVDIFGLAPEDWLWRMWWILANSGERPHPQAVLHTKDNTYIKAMVKVSKRLVKFLYHIWMEKLYPDNSEWKFRPADFLRYNQEIESFNNHGAYTWKS